MSGQSLTFGQMSLMDTPNATSSPASESGVTLSDKPDGPTIGPSGQGVVRASLSARQAKEAGLMTSDTSGRRGIGLLASDALAWSLVSKLRVETDLLGSTLYELTWKQRATPSGRSIYALRASARRTSGNGFTSWPTPRTNDANTESAAAAEKEMGRKSGGGQKKLAIDVHLAAWPTPQKADDNQSRQSLESAAREMARPNRSQNLAISATLASWPTPNAGPQNDTDGRWEERRAETKERVQNGNGFGMTLGMASTLASWPTPQANNAERGGSEQRATNPERSNDLHDFALLASWPTPNAMEGGQTSRSGERKDEMLMGGMVQPSPEGPARLTASGVMLTGFAAGMDAGGQLNPALPRWLQALPPEWDASAVTAMPSTRKSPKASSKPT